MTIPAQDIVERREWLIRKDGYFYRPNCQGYTTRKIEAGRYTKEKAEAEAAIEPWHMSAVHQDEVPDEPAVADLNATISRLTADNETLRKERDALHEYAHEATKAITGLTVGGSEYFGKRIGEMYTADLPFCVERIRDRMRYKMDAMRATARADALAQENGRLRNVVSKVCAALPNGAFCSPECSIEFMEEVPGEVAGVIAALGDRP